MKSFIKKGASIALSTIITMSGFTGAVPMKVQAETSGLRTSREVITKEVNVAVNKPSYNSSTSPASYANDNNLSTVWKPGSKNDGEKNHWWSVDCGREYNIKRIEIYDGNEGWGAHRKNLVVEGANSSDFSDAVILDSIGDAVSDKYTQNGCWTINPQTNPYRYIRIRRTDTQDYCPYLREVKVFADINLTEILQGKPSYASNSANTNYGPEYAVDGSLDTSWLSYNNDYPCWYADLGAEYSIDYIEYWYKNDENDETRRFFDIVGSNEPLSADTDFDSLHKFISRDGNQNNYISYPWEGTVNSPKTYRYIGYRKTYNVNTISSISEIKAYTIAPDVNRVTVSNDGVSIRFSDEMNETTLNPDEIKIYDIASGSVIEYTDYTYEDLVYIVNVPLEPNKAYRVLVSTSVTNKKNSSLAKEYSQTFINGTITEYGEDVYEKRVLANVAQFKPVTTSIKEASSAHAPEFANDGLVDENKWAPTDNFKDSSDKHSWWSVDLGRDYEIKCIEIYDGNEEWDAHRKNLVIEGANSADFSDAVTLDSIGNTTNDKYTRNGCWSVVPKTNPYRYVRIRKTDSQSYCPYLREVKVFAEQTVTEVSRNKPVEACGEYNDIHSAKKANDGINLNSTNSAWVRNWREESDHYCWWRVDLGQSYYIDYFEIEDRINIPNTKRNFEIKGTNNESTADITFADSQKLAYLGSAAKLHELQGDPFPNEGVWTSAANSDVPYRFIVWRSTNSAASAGLAEFRACVVNPEIYEFKAINNQIYIKFSDNMLDVTLNPETIKVYDAEGNEVSYTDYTADGKTYTINSIELNGGKEYTVEIGGGARNEKLVPVARVDSKKTFTYGEGYDVEYFELTDNVDADGANFGSLLDGGVFEAKASINNYSGEAINALIITALYKDERLYKVNTTEEVATNDAKTALSTSIALPESGTHEYIAKAFLWEWENDQIKPLVLSKEAKVKNVFNTDVLDIIPEYEETAETTVDGLTSIYYDALPYEGKETKVYAYYGIPEHAEGEKVPGVVLVHGGGGTAYPEWVKSWNARGYAAIAMDLGGNTPLAGNTKYQHPYAGPSQCTYNDLYKDIENTWMYHAVADVVLAHNILRSFDDVDSTRIGITGVSWGGVVTTTTLGVDDRFAFAVPIYGCGHLYESETYFKDNLTSRNKYIDPAEYLKRSELPILFVNDDTDYHFSTTITTKSYDDVSSHAQITFLPETAHSQETAQAMKEPYEFADSIVKGEKELIKITSAEVTNGVATVTYDVPDGREAVRAYLRYNNDETFTYASAACTSTWTNVEAESMGDGNLSITVPEECTHFYISIVDADGNIVSTKQFFN